MTSIIIPGNSSDFIDYTASGIAVSSPTQIWIGGRFRVTEQLDETGSGTLFRVGPANGGSSVNWSPVGNNSTFNLRHRVFVNGSSQTYSSPQTPIVVGDWYEFMILADYTEGFIRGYINGVQVFEQLKAAPEDVWTWYNFATAAAIPRMTGATIDGKNFEVSHFVAHIGGLITDTEAETFSFATDNPATLSVPPTWGIVEPTGTGGTHATTLEDVYGTSDMSQVAGPVSPSAGFPYFTGGASDILTAGVATSTALTISIGGESSVSDGTVYIVGDLASNWSSAPDDSHILTGKLADGTTDAWAFRSVDMTGLTEFLEVFSPAQANAEYIFYVLHDTDDSGTLSNRMSFEIATKIPVVSPGEGFIWRDANGSPLVNETGMVVERPLGTPIAGLTVTTDENAIGVVNVSAIVNGGAALDIGDQITLHVVRTNGEELTVRNATIITGAE